MTSQAIPAQVLTAPIATVVALARFNPGLVGDRGVFVSAAATVANGDRMYSDFFDHKDPLLYYAWGLASLVGGADALFFVDAILLVVAAVLAASMVARCGGATVESVVAGVATAALLSHDHVYLTGMSQLPGIVATLWLAHAALAERARQVGVATVLIAFVKLPLLAIGLPIVVFVGRRWGAHVRRRAATTAAVTGAGVLALLTIRGELAGYVDAVDLNLGYARTVLDIRGDARPPVGTAAAAIDTITADRSLWIVLATLVLTLAATCATAIRRSADGARPGQAPLVAVIAAVAGLVIFLGASTLFAHHLQVVGILPALLVPAVVTTWRTPLEPGRIAAVAAVAATAVLPLASDVDSALDPPSVPASELSEFVEANVAPREPTVRYALFGENLDQGIVAHLDDRYELVCPMTYQLPWFGEDRLADHLQCMAEEASVIVVPQDTTTRAEYEARNDTYRRYREDAWELLERDFRLAASGDVTGFAASVWVRPDSGAS